MFRDEYQMKTMEKSLDLAAAVKIAIEEARRDMGKVNVLIAGRTGVGKSTLINSIFHGRLAATGQGEPVTRTTRLFSKEGVPLAIWDTRGLEMSDFDDTLNELTQLVEQRAKEPEPQDHIHVAWLCLHEDGRRVEPAETKLCRALAQHMPVLGVITKARSDDGFRDEVQRLLPETKNVVRIRAIAEKFDDSDHSLPPMGLDDLVELTAAVLPEGIRRAFVAAQMVSLRQKAQQAHAVIGAAATSAAAAAAVPIPFADAVILVPIQVSMLAGVSVVFGLDTSKAFLGVLVATATGATGTTLAGRAIVTNLLKFIPGGGQVVGGTLSAATAAALTTVLGEIYIASLVAVFTRTGGEVPEVDAVKQEFTKRVKAAMDDSFFGKLKSAASRWLGHSR